MVVVLSILVVVFSMFMSMRLKGILTDIGLGPLGGVVNGVIAPDSQNVIRLVATEPVAGLRQSQPPALEDIPNNHLSYAVQWFLFAGIALVIFLLALRGRNKGVAQSANLS